MAMVMRIAASTLQAANCWLALSCLATVAAGQSVPLTFNFETGSQGWTAVNNSSFNCPAPISGPLAATEYFSIGGHPGGYLRTFEGGFSNSNPRFRSGSLSPSDFSSAYGGFLRYDRKLITTLGDEANFEQNDDVYLYGTVSGNPVTLIADTVGRPLVRWNATRAPLLEGVWRVGSCSGPQATQAEIVAVLTNLDDIRFKAEYRSGSGASVGTELSDIDNVMLVGPGSAPQSVFEYNTDGWTVVGDATIAWDDVPNTHPQCIHAVDAVTGIGYDFVAPVNFLGDQSAAAGLTVELDLWAQIGTSTPNGTSGFIRISGSGTTLWYNKHTGSGPNGGEQPIIGDRWRHHAVPLRPSPAWTVGSSCGPAATQADFDLVLGSVTSFRVRGEYATGPEEERLDNVVFGACSPSVVVSIQNGFTWTQCPITPAAFVASAGGASPFAYYWEIESPPDSYQYVPVSGTEFIDPTTGLSLGLAGTGTDMLTVTVNSLGTHPGTIRVRTVVSNACGSYTGSSASLNVMTATADINADGQVNVDDLLAVINAWGPCAPCPAACPADIAPPGGDGVVNVDDLLAAINGWGTCS